MKINYYSHFKGLCDMAGIAMFEDFISYLLCSNNTPPSVLMREMLRQEKLQEEFRRNIK